MSTIVVWVLVAYLGVGYGGGPLVIDNIASRENCEALRKAVANVTPRGTPRPGKSHCIAVRKARP